MKKKVTIKLIYEIIVPEDEVEPICESPSEYIDDPRIHYQNATCDEEDVE